MSSNVLAEIWRGGQLESIHTGAYVVVDPTGKVVLSGGDVDRPVFPRSAIKIIQALPLVLDGSLQLIINQSGCRPLGNLNQSSLHSNLYGSYVLK